MFLDGGQGFEFRDRPIRFTLGESRDGKPRAEQVFLVAEAGALLVGKVRIFNAAKGYGFIASSSLQAGEDVFFGRDDIPPGLQGAVFPNQPVKFTLGYKQDGKAHAKDLHFSMGFGSMGPMMPPMMHPMMQAPAMAKGGGKGPGQEKATHGVVKSYFPDKGYGFINAQGVLGDIYFQSDGVPYDKGMAVSFYLATKPDGRMSARAVAPGLASGEMSVGSVMSFSMKKGFGFISVDDHVADVYFKADQVSEQFRDDDLVGKSVQFTVSTTVDGKPRADGEVTVTHSGASPTPTSALKRKVPLAQAGPIKKAKGAYASGSVISYNATKAFGFIKSDEVEGDVYFKGNYPNLTAGAQLMFELTWTPSGKPQAQTVIFL